MQLLTQNSTFIFLENSSLAWLSDEFAKVLKFISNFQAATLQEQFVLPMIKKGETEKMKEKKLPGGRGENGPKTYASLLPFLAQQ